jgi:hypothetical protein
MIQLCTNDPLPSFSDMYNSFTSNLVFPPKMVFNLPEFPTLKSPFFGSISMTNFELVNMIEEIQTWQIMLTLKNIIKPLLDVIGGVLKDWLPKIPGLGLNLLDLLDINPTKLYETIATAIKNAGASIWAIIPSPIFGSLSIPDFEIATIAKLVVKDYIMLIPKMIYNLLKTIVYIVARPFMNLIPELPEFPTIQQITDTITSMFPSMDSISKILSMPTFDISKVFDFTWNGFPKITIPSPLFPSFSMPEIEFKEALNIMYGQMILTPLKKIKDFITSVLSSLGFSFPTICVPVPSIQGTV